MNFTLAHFSDLHLGPLPSGAVWGDFRLKRLIGGVSWHANRKRRHLTEIAHALAADIQHHRPDHIAFTGDAVNIAAPSEFPHVKTWIENLAAPEGLSYTPGNHDTYVKLPWDKGIGHLDAYMTGEMKGEVRFPFVRLRRNIALIGLNSAEPRGLHSAQGRLGEAQRTALAERLQELRRKGFYRLVMIHHPPAPGLAAKLRALTDAKELRDILCAEKVELVIHGHNHRPSLNWLPAGDTKIPVVGVPSASMSETTAHPAEWNLYEISRAKGQWQTRCQVRRWSGPAHGFVQATAHNLSAGEA